MPQSMSVCGEKRNSLSKNRAENPRSEKKFQFILISEEKLIKWKCHIKVYV